MPLAETLDESHGATVTQHEIFNAHSRKYEAEFIDDLYALGIRLPDALTRVTEYVPKIVSFVEAIIAKRVTPSAQPATPRGDGQARTHGSLANDWGW